MKFFGQTFLFTQVLFLLAVLPAYFSLSPDHITHVHVHSHAVSSLLHRTTEQLVEAYQVVAVNPAFAGTVFLEERYSFDHVTVVKNRAGLRVSCFYERPVAQIGTHILKVNNKLAEVDFFNKSYTETLPFFALKQELITQKQRAPSGLFLFVTGFNSDLLNTYHVLWHNALSVELQEKADPNFPLFTTAYTHVDDEFLRTYKKVKSEIESMPVIQKKGITCIDMRFKNQIVVC